MDKTYVFDTAESGGLNSSALIASLMQNKGVDPNLMAMLTNASKNQDAWGGSGCWFMWVILLFWLWGGNGYGNGFGRCAADGIPNQLNNDFGREVLLQAINGNGQALSQLATTLNCDVNSLQTAIGNVQSSVQSVASQVGMTGQQIINSIQQGNCSLGNQLAQCCCSINDAITRTNYENQISNVNQTNTLQNAINFVNSSVERGFADSIKRNLSNAELDTGFAYSSYDKQCSIVVIHKASSIGEFINTFEHEKNHLEMHICEALDINPYSEEAAHMSGDLAQLILEEALYSIVEL